MADSRTFLQLSTAIFRPRKATPEQQDIQDKGRQVPRKKIYKCSQKCKKHLFLMIRKGDGRSSVAFGMNRYCVEHRFCPSQNKLIGTHEGGIPQFNHDRRIDTPSFVSKFDKVNRQTTTNKIYRQIFQDNLAKATNSTSVSTRNFQKGLSHANFNKIKDQSLNETISEFMRILRAKDRATNEERPSQ